MSSADARLREGNFVRQGAEPENGNVFYVGDAGGSVVRLHHRDEGRGRGLLLVHGWGGDLRAWDPVVAELPEEFRVISADLRGHGGSPVPAHGYHPADLAADLAGLLAELGTGPVVAIGHSMGAQVVTVLAVEYPAWVDSLVVIDPAYGADAAEERTFAGRLAALEAEGPGAAVRQLGEVPGAVRDQLLATPGPVLAQCYEGMYLAPDAFGTRPAAEKYLARRTVPALCLRARVEPAVWEAAIPAPPGSEVVVWEGAGHFLHLERPRDFVRLLTRWPAR
jgi:pimeloyl-ACP methyl ester carboxylesterase